MKPHPDFATLEIPKVLILGPYQLNMLTAADLEADYEAVTRSASVLQGIFGDDWPQGLTLQENLCDLHWHHREFTSNRSFAWAIRDKDRRYLGCAYLTPDIAARGGAEACYWMAEAPLRQNHLATFGPLYAAWLAAFLPATYALAFTSNADL